MAKTDVEHFRQNVRSRCEKHGSIQKLATAAGITRVYLSEIINGHKNPSLDVALDIASGLGETIDALIVPPPTDRRKMRKVS